MKLFLPWVFLAVLASFFLAGCASDDGSLAGGGAAANTADVPGAAHKDPEPSANGGWKW